MQKISEDSKNSHLKFSNSLKSNVKNSIQKISSSHLNFVPRPRPRAPRLQLVGRPPVVEVEAPQVKSWAKRSRQRCASNFKQNNFIFLNKSHYHIDTQKKKIEHDINNQHILDDPCRPPPRPLSAASLTAVCRTTHRSVAAARSATHGCRWWRPGGKEIVKDLDGYDENLREMDLFEQRMEKAKLSKELQKS